MLSLTATHRCALRKIELLTGSTLLIAAPSRQNMLAFDIALYKLSSIFLSWIFLHKSGRNEFVFRLFIFGTSGSIFFALLSLYNCFCCSLIPSFFFLEIIYYLEWNCVPYGNLNLLNTRNIKPHSWHFENIILLRALLMISCSIKKRSQTSSAVRLLKRLFNENLKRSLLVEFLEALSVEL